MGNFYGIPGIKFISHGEWSDPEVEYKGYTFNYWDVEDSLYDLFKQEFEPYEDDLYVSKDTGEVLSFEDWLNQNKDLVYGELDDFVAFSKYDYDDIADDDYFDDDGYYSESKRVNERQSDRSFIDYKETDFDNPDIEYTVVVFKYDEKMGKTYYFDNYAEAKEFARNMKNQDNVKDVMIREEEIWGRSDTAEFSASDPLKYNSDDGEWYKSIGRDNHGEMQYKRYGESKNRGKKKVSEEYIKAPYEDEAKRFCTAIEKLANNKDALENFENYISHHFQVWLDKWARTPEDIISEFKNFAELNF